MSSSSPSAARHLFAGSKPIVFLLRRTCGSIPKTTANSLRGMVYGVICFATLASFVGMRADQSWGSFWCWYPKENGALHIVIWSAILLHARWGGMISQVIIMALGLIRESAVCAGDYSFTAKPDET